VGIGPFDGGEVFVICQYLDGDLDQQLIFLRMRFFRCVRGSNDKEISYEALTVSLA